MHIIQQLRNFVRLPADLSVHPQVRKHFRRNFLANGLDSAFWVLGESFVSVSTILPVFASTITDSALLIGLVPALINAGWFIPQFLMASYVQSLPRKLPFTKLMGAIERIPFIFLPLTALMLIWVPRELALVIFLIVVAWRGFASGMVALPWQELIATVIPSTVRSRFLGVSRTFGRVLAVLGSAAAGVILAELSYPYNYALSFTIGAVFVWLSYLFFCRTIEPVDNVVSSETARNRRHRLSIDLSAYLRIIKSDINMRLYLGSRIFFQLGSMATVFLAVYGIQRFSLPDEQAAVFSIFLFISGVAGFSFWGVYGDQMGPRKMLLISDCIQLIVLVIAIIAPVVWVYYLVFLLLGFSQSGYMIGELMLGLVLGKESQRPIYLGLARSIPGLFILIAPIVGGALATWIGYQNMFWVAILFSLIDLAFLFGVKEAPVDDGQV